MKSGSDSINPLGLTPEEEESLLNEAREAFRNSKTLNEVAQVWKSFYARVGHKRLGRVLLEFASKTPR